MASIRQNAYPDLLPDFRNLAVMARLLVGANLALFAGALFAASNLTEALERFVQAAAFLEPLLLAVIAMLFVLSEPLRRLPYWQGCVAVLAIVLLQIGRAHV